MMKLMLPIFLLFTCLTTGCMSMTDVTDENKYWGGYEPNAKFKLKRDVFLVSCQGIDEINPPEQYDSAKPRYPNDIAVYRSSPSSWPDVIAVIHAGTTIRIDAFMQSPWPTNALYVCATILDGPHHSRTGDINSLSDLSEAGVFGYAPDPTYLERMLP